MSGAGVRAGAVSSTVVWLLVVVSWGSSLELPVGGAGRGADGWAAGLGSGLSIPARATSTSSTTVHSKSSGWSMVWAELDGGGTCGQTGVVVSCAVGAVGEGGGPADVFPGLGGAHLVGSGGSGGGGGHGVPERGSARRSVDGRTNLVQSGGGSGAGYGSQA
jgi:hypothetical protein